MGSPSTPARPPVGVTKPASTLSRVDFPQPDGPRTHTNCPPGTSSERRSRTSRRSLALPRRTTTSLNVTLPARDRAGGTAGKVAAAETVVGGGGAGVWWGGGGRSAHVSWSWSGLVASNGCFEISRRNELLIGRPRLDLRQSLLLGEKCRRRYQRIDKLSLCF